MPGRLLRWPEQWPEFTAETGEQDEDLVKYKSAIVSQYGEDALRKSWLRVCKELESVTENLAHMGTSTIPEIQFEELPNLSEDRKKQLKDVGCFVVRGVIGETQATQWFNDLQAYVADNKDQISGWSQPTPVVMNIYFSPTQMAARSHPNQLKTARELNSLWHDSTGTSSAEPLSYADAVRIRPAGVPMYTLGPHIDAGSLSRWGDPTYRSCYSAVWSGHPEDLDLYDLTKRQYAKQACFGGAAHSTVLRAFQGWTALTPAGPGEGSLMLYPSVKWATAYFLLRPFFSPPTSGDVMDAARWGFDPTSPWFPGTYRERSQMLSPTSHPHLRLPECMCSIPPMRPGDTVWWHADMCHAVEAEHDGDHEASVAYIAATPRTEENLKYMKAQLKDFLDGRPPEDFRHEKRKAAYERGFKGFLGETGILSQEGRRAMAFED